MDDKLSKHRTIKLQKSEFLLCSLGSQLLYRREKYHVLDVTITNELLPFDLEQASDVRLIDLQEFMSNGGMSVVLSVGTIAGTQNNRSLRPSAINALLQYSKVPMLVFRYRDIYSKLKATAWVKFSFSVNKNRIDLLQRESPSLMAA